MFHGDNERVDIDSLVLSTELWDAVARDCPVVSAAGGADERQSGPRCSTSAV